MRLPEAFNALTIGLALTRSFKPEAPTLPTSVRETNNQWSGDVTATAFAPKATVQPREAINGWPRQDAVAIVENSPIFKDYNYTTCERDLPPELKGQLPVSISACAFPQDPGTLHFLPNSDCLQPLLKDPETKIDPGCSISSIVLNLKGNSTTVDNAAFYVHPKGEEDFVEGNPNEHLNPKVKQFVEEATGSKDFKSEEFVDAAMNCGPNAVGLGTGENFKEDVGGYEIKVLKGKGEEKKFAGITNHDCSINVSNPNEPEDNPTGGWLGKKLSSLAQRAFIQKNSYGVCGTKAADLGLPSDPTGEICEIPEEKGIVIMAPNPNDLQELKDTFPNITSADKTKSYGNLELHMDTEDPIDKNSIIKEIWFRFHTELEEMINDGPGGNEGERAAKVFRDFFQQATGQGDVITQEMVRRLIKYAQRCGAHAVPDGQGNGYKVNGDLFEELADGIVIKVSGGEEKKSEQKPKSLPEAKRGDCAFIIYNSTEQNDNSQANNPQENSSGSNWSKYSKAKALTAAVSVATANYLRFAL